MEKQIQDYQSKKNDIQNQKDKIKKESDELDIERVKQQQENVNKIKNNIFYIQNLIEDFKQQQLEINKLQHEEKILTDLYNIFSKELMLMVLEDFLPQMENIMNNFLSQVVDYQVKFEYITKSSDKIELEVNILDSLGTRPVKSLSGGQRTILKLVWIMSVCSLLRTKFLFLDETINNLDFDTIGRVSSLLEDFVKLTDIKFYAITHSRQIQQMDIWDDRVVIEN